MAALRQHRSILIALIAVALAAAISIALFYALRPGAYVPAPPFAQVQALARFEENGVRVTIDLERDQAGTLLLASTYTPEEPDSHVYSIDLPRTGIDGAGRPTRLDLPPQQAARAIGPLRANQPLIMQTFQGFSAPFPIYPDGPVTLRLPLDLAPHGAAAPLELTVGYMACSSKGACLPPVTDKHIAVTLAARP